MKINNEPLASRLRPKTLDDYCGQQHLTGQGKIIRNMIEKDSICSMIFWGPPGVGKTTLARIIANATNAQFITFSAVNSSIKEIRKIMSEANLETKTIVFIDEIHRFNKAQQDAFLPYVEKGLITLIGATTENPSFEVNSALLSRCKVFVLKELNVKDLVELLKRAIISKDGFGEEHIEISDDLLHHIAVFSNGDARSALNTLEMVVLNSEDGLVTKEIVAQCTGRKSLLYDKDGEEHYNLISALHKSMRNSEVDAALYYLARMLEGGEDPLYIARRLVRFASEDIGMADSKALEIAVAGYQACHFLGMPECNVHLAHVVTYLSLSVKSNSLYVAYEKAKRDANETMAQPVPLHIRNASTKLMKEVGYGKGYQYAHDFDEHISPMSTMPDNLKGHHYYIPGHLGSETKVRKRMQDIENIRKNIKE